MLTPPELGEVFLTLLMVGGTMPTKNSQFAGAFFAGHSLAVLTDFPLRRPEFAHLAIVFTRQATSRVTTNRFTR